MTPEANVRDAISGAAQDAVLPVLPFSRSPDSMARLVQDHNEAVETARLANCLGRAPYAAAALVAGAALVFVFSFSATPLAPLIVWCLFIVAGGAALLRLYRQAARSAFELLPLRAFALDLHAIMLYAGFAWGAGSLLALPLYTGGFALSLYAIGGAAVMAAICRSRAATVYFVVPGAGLPVLAALTGSAGLAAAGAILVLGAALGMAAEFAERLVAKRLGAPPLPLQVSLRLS